MADSPLTTAAIDAALTQNWTEAIKINTAILKENKTDIDALNRLGFAHLMKGEFTTAKKWFEKVIELDQYNQIALRNLKKLTIIRKKDIETDGKKQISPLSFLEEPGITKVATCINLAPQAVLSTLTAGQEVTLKAKNHSVEIRDARAAYLGALPDDLAFRLIKLMQTGNTYQVIIKGVGKNSMTVLLREIARSKKLADQPSFITPINYTAYTNPADPTSIEKPDVTPTGEEEPEAAEPQDEPATA